MRISAKDPAAMTAGEVNRELKALREADGRLADEFIAAGRGHERPSDYLDPKRTDDLSRRAQAISRRISALTIEVEMRAGPGFHELPYSRRRGSFGPRTKVNPMKKTRRTKSNPVDSTHLHLIRVDYVGPTNTRGSRVKLTSLRFPKSTYSTGFDSVYNSTLDQADDILKGMGYTVAAHGELPRGFIVGVKQFEPLPKKGGTIAKRNPGMPAGNIEWTEVKRRGLSVTDRGTYYAADGKVVYWGGNDAVEAQNWLRLRAKGLGGRGASALSARLGPTRRNPFRRAATALVSYVDAGRRFYAVVIGRKVGWSTSHAQATPLTLSNARGLKSLMAQRGYSVDIAPA